MPRRIAVIGDKTTTGGKIISASGSAFDGTSGVALQGDLAYCPKCKSTGKIIEGATTFVIDGKPAAYTGCIIACKCSPIGINKIIATKSDMYVNEPTSYSTTNTRTSSNITPQTNTVNNITSFNKQTHTAFGTTSLQENRTSENDKDLIRIDARRLLKCADELCEKHLYHDGIKQGFKQEVKNLANDIVYQVDTGAMTYEEGYQIIKDEENSLWEQAFNWSKNGLSVLGGVGMTITGIGLCMTGWGCLIGAPLMVHGINGAYEGGGGIYNGIANAFDGGDRSLEVDGLLREGYKKTAEVLGFNSSVGNLVYDLVDFGISVKGKLKLVPKMNTVLRVNEFNPYNKSKTLKLWRYGRQDLEKTYLQMKKILLTMEVYGDTLSLIDIYRDLKKAFILDTNTKQVSMVVSEPEKISNLKEIIENCSLVITITGDYDDVPAYYSCERIDGSKYKEDLSGNVLDGDKN
ncbi:PAAR domain-containing protein (plasmid) [Orbus sturtevantii]|uniref:PAAR domain-containing protein n=1 Tax=Orbus sturtevantii TaxID=3074109 RepID=UPI00370CFDDA